MQETVTRRPSRVRPAGWWFDALLLVAFAALTAALAAGWLLDLDRDVADWLFAHEWDPGYWVARTLNFLGSGGPLTVISGIIAIWLGIRRRSIWPLALVVAAFLATGFAIMPLKLWTDRAAPRSILPDAVEIFNHLPPDEYSLSYPSGHMVNTIVWYGVLALLLAPWLGRTARRWLRIAPPTIVFVTTVYLNYHWVTDSIAGVLLGIVLDRLLARVPWPALPRPDLETSGEAPPADL
ncbi:phosphatase PAP2 family protein [Phytohabitans kaempferiae]|uniref:Phosphatase PAP2 family protein n=1 Tax=Phytohabitans kaempferiae TaxID=1620943 RepID=A0ABV6MG60_9ACTN